MDTIILIVSLVAAIAAVLALVFMVRNSKDYVIKKIEQKERQIHNLEHECIQTHDLNDDMNRYSEYSVKRHALEESIMALRKRI